MKRQWLAYVIVVLLAIGAGVAVAGLPDTSPAAATITPSTAVVPETTASATSVPESTEPETTEPETTESETTESETTEPETTESTEPEDTEPNPTAPDTTESGSAELPDRSELKVATANGANVAGAALRVATQLEGLGYVEVLPLNGTDIVEFTVVYYADGFEEAAQRLAADLDLLADFVAPLDDAPAVVDLPDDVELLVYIGRDRA